MEGTDRVTVVTDAFSGVGEGTARALTREGCAVVLRRAAKRTEAVRVSRAESVWAFKATQC